ncbi:MAG: flagellar biosynthetic protein FliO [Deltaproteobacteria bacterium]|nr:flagellar biosynthetic protein FliO [Deltaproteobacteria bacterium]
MDTDFNMISLKLAIFFMVMFALMILFFYIMRRVKGGAFAMGKYSLMKNLATLSLGPKRSLALIEVCDQWILVGVGSESISLISKIDKPSDLSQFDKSLPHEENLFDSFLSKAGLRLKMSESGSEKDE